MLRNRALFFIFLFFSICFFAENAEAKTSDDVTPSPAASEKAPTFIPLTNGDMVYFLTASDSEKWKFIYSFYRKNKDVGATDSQILNELLKIDAVTGENSEMMKKLSQVGKYFDDMESFFDSAIEGINSEILLNNPGRTDLLIKPNEPKSWTNVQYVAIGDKTIRELIEEFNRDKYFSDVVQTDYGSFMLTGCASRPNTSKVLMSFVAILEPGYSMLLQREGQPISSIDADFSNSENLVFGSLYKPLPKKLKIDGGNALGYTETNYIPFYADVSDAEELSTVNARLNFTLCNGDDCSLVETPEISYMIKTSSSLESVVCPRLQQFLYNVPENQNAAITIRKISFKKQAENIDLLISIKLPFFGTGRPDLMISNESGLLFSEPFIIGSNKELLYKLRVMNPDQLKENSETPLTLYFSYSAKTTELKEIVPFGKSILSYFKFSVLGIISSFVLGLIFIVSTPLLTAFLMLLNQQLLVRNKTAQRTVDFYNGLGKSFYIVISVYIFLFLLFWLAAPSGYLFWGIQFNLPILNLLFMSLFFIASIWASKMFDDAFVEKRARRIKLWTDIFLIEAVREKAGLLVGLAIGGLMLITPMIGLYFEVFTMLSQSVILHTIFFLAGVILPFILLSFLDNKGAAIHVEKKPPYFDALILLPLIAQGGGLFLLVALQTGLYIGLGVALLTVTAYLLYRFREKIKLITVKKILFGYTVIGLLLVPFLPNDYNLNNYGAADFNEEILRDAVKNGKVVYLNVTESGCLTCQINRLVMIYRGGPEEIREGRLLVMGINYNHPFIRNRMADTGGHILPENLIFSPIYPEGKNLPDIIGPWTSVTHVRDALGQKY